MIDVCDMLEEDWGLFDGNDDDYYRRPDVRASYTYEKKCDFKKTESKNNKIINNSKKLKTLENELINLKKNL